MGAYSAGSRKNLKHDEEKLHAAGSKTEKKRKKVLTKLQDDEKEPPAAGSKKKKALLPDRIRRFEEILQVKEKPEAKTVKLELTGADIKFLEGYDPLPPFHSTYLDDSTDYRLRKIVEGAKARYQVKLESRKRALKQLKDEGFAELEVEVDDVQDNDFDEIEKFLDDAKV